MIDLKTSAKNEDKNGTKIEPKNPPKIAKATTVVMGKMMGTFIRGLKNGMVTIIESPATTKITLTASP